MSEARERALRLLDGICQDSLESNAADQEPEDGEISALFHELRGLVVATYEELKRLRGALREIEALDSEGHDPGFAASPDYYAGIYEAACFARAALSEGGSSPPEKEME